MNIPAQRKPTMIEDILTRLIRIIIPAIVVLYFACSFLKSGIDDWNKSQYLHLNGRMATATIVEHIDVFRSFALRYRYEAIDMNGRHLQLESVDKTNALVNLSLGSTSNMTVLYDPRNPTYSIIESSHTYVFDISVGSFFVLVVIVLTIHSVRGLLHHTQTTHGQ